MAAKESDRPSAKTTLGYGHDRKGAALGDAANEGLVNVVPPRQDDASEGSGPTIAFTLDGRAVTAREGETIWQVAERHGVAIPHLCHSPAPGYRADGNCRACVVEIAGERVLTASCIRKPTPVWR
jgi:formate dehydrogenase major subunit